MDLHVEPSSGSSVNVGEHIVDMLFPPPADGRIATIAVCGIPDALRTSHILTHLFQMSGYETGLATHRGHWISGELVARYDFANHKGTSRVLSHPFVDAAIMEVTVESILSEGLGFDLCDVAVITDRRLTLSEAERSPEHLAALSTLVRAARRAVILDIGGPLPEAILTAIAQKRTYSVSPQPAGAIAAHVTHVCQRGGNAVVMVSTEATRLVALPESCTITGDIMLALAAGDAVGIPCEHLEDAFKAAIDPSVEPRLITSVPATGVGRLLLATPRNSSEVAEICQMARSWAAPRKPDVIIQMSFRADTELEARLARELKSGFGKRFELDGSIPLRRQLAGLSIHSREPGEKLLILTDNMNSFRKML
jgi:hypothetical protein